MTPRAMKRMAALVSGAGLVALLAACTPGPKPETTVALPPTPATNASITPINPASGAPQTFDVGAHVQAQWWKGFGSPALDALVDRALAANNDLAAAEASLRQAHALAGAAASAAFAPQVSASYAAERAQASQVISPPLADGNDLLYTLHTAQLTVSYPVDVFGGGRAKVRSARAAAAAQAMRARAARTTVVSNLVLAVIQRAALQEQLEAARTSVETGRGVLDLLRRRQKLGAVGDVDIAAQEAQLASAEAAVPALEKQVTHQKALISTLIGEAPGAPLPALPELADLHLPASLPVSLPSQLVVERPDVRAAQVQMVGAAADVGAAIAARLPAFQIDGNVGGQALKFSEMFASGNLFWDVIGQVTQPIFDGGALLRQKHAADAAFEASKAQYRGAVLQAFVDVSDALGGLQGDAKALDAAVRGEGAASRQLLYTRRQLDLGAVGTLEVLNAQSAQAQAAQTLVQARAARLSDTVALYQALGGGVLPPAGAAPETKE